MSRSRDVAQILGKTDAVNTDNHALLNTSSGVDSAEVVTLVTAHSTNLDSADIQTISAPLTNRNLIINGAMQVAQRGTSQTAASYGSLDRFSYNLSGGAGTMSQQTLALGSEQRGSKHFLRIACTTGNDNHGFFQRIEDARSVSTSIHTLSFDAKGTNPNGGTFTIKVDQDFGSGGSPSADVTLALQTFTVTSSFQTFDFQFDIPSLSGKTLGSDNNSHVKILISQGADTSTNAWTLDITNIQFEIGEQATPFEHRTYGDELARCQRYYEKINVKGYFSAGVAGNALSTYGASVSMSVGKRSTPTITLPASGTSTGQIAFVNGTANFPTTVGTNSVAFVTDNRFSIRGVGYAGLTTGQVALMYAGGQVSLEADAEL